MPDCSYLITYRSTPCLLHKWFDLNWTRRQTVITNFNTHILTSDAPLTTAWGWSDFGAVLHTTHRSSIGCFTQDPGGQRLPNAHRQHSTAHAELYNITEGQSHMSTDSTPTVKNSFDFVVIPGRIMLLAGLQYSGQGQTTPPPAASGLTGGGCCLAAAAAAICLSCVTY